LLDKQITTGLREGMIRYSPHFYCSAEEMKEAVYETRLSLGIT